MTQTITMTKKTRRTITPCASNYFGHEDKIDDDYIAARERLRAALSALSAIVDEYDADPDRTFGHVGSLNLFAELVEQAAGVEKEA